MSHRVLIVGVERDVEPLIADRLACPYVYAETLPPIRVVDGELFVQRTGGVARGAFLSVSHVLYHGIYEDDLDIITALAVWDGPCLPAGRAMLKARPRVPCLLIALEVTAYPGGPRGYAFGGVTITADAPRVAKFGQMHCGEGKDLFTGPRACETSTLIEPYVDGRAVRIMAIGERVWQIRLEGDDWKKSIHASRAAFEPPREDLVADTRRLMDHFGLEVAGVDYMIGADDVPVLLEVNHIPNVDRFEEVRDAYVAYALWWLGERGVPLKTA